MIQHTIIACVIAMLMAFKNRPQVQGIDSQLFHMGNPVLHLLYGVRDLLLMILRCANKAQRINVIKYCFFDPACHKFTSNISIPWNRVGKKKKDAFYASSHTYSIGIKRFSSTLRLSSFGKVIFSSPLSKLARISSSRIAFPT